MSEADTPVARLEREEFARGHLKPGESPVEPRPAATVAVAREGGSAGLRVLLLRRPLETRFAAGAYVFPGGVVDAADADPRLTRALPEDADGEERPALVAALRELFEETALLPADRPVPAPELGRLRYALVAGRIGFAEVVDELGARFRRLQVAYFARWITPARLRRRYDARFFLIGHDREPRLTEEHTEHAWLAPAEALDRFRAGELPMLLPTWRSLERLARFGSLEEALSDLRSRPVRATRPRLLVEGDRVRPVLPGEPGYARAALEPDAE